MYIHVYKKNLHEFQIWLTFVQVRLNMSQPVSHVTTIYLTCVPQVVPTGAPGGSVMSQQGCRVVL